MYLYQYLYRSCVLVYTVFSEKMLVLVTLYTKVFPKFHFCFFHFYYEAKKKLIQNLQTYCFQTDSSFHICDSRTLISKSCLHSYRKTFKDPGSNFELKQLEELVLLALIKCKPILYKTLALIDINSF